MHGTNMKTDLRWNIATYEGKFNSDWNIWPSDICDCNS